MQKNIKTNTSFYYKYNKSYILKNIFNQYIDKSTKLKIYF